MKIIIGLIINLSVGFLVNASELVFRGTPFEFRPILTSTTDALFGKWQIDASGLDEDVSLSSFAFYYVSTDDQGTAIQNVRVRHGQEILTTGNHAVNPPFRTNGGTYGFSFDRPLVIKKGAITSMDLIGDISESAVPSSLFMWGTSIELLTGLDIIGLTSGKKATVTGENLDGLRLSVRLKGRTRTVPLQIHIEDRGECEGCKVASLGLNIKANYSYEIFRKSDLNEQWESFLPTRTSELSGRLGWTVERFNPGQTRFYQVRETAPIFLNVSTVQEQSRRLAIAGRGGVTLGQMRLEAKYSNVFLEKIGLKLGNPDPSTVDAFTSIKLYDENVEIASTRFLPSGIQLQATLFQPLRVLMGQSKILTIKADLAPISAASNHNGSGAILGVDFDNDHPENTSGITEGSGENVVPDGQALNPGVMIVKSMPTIELDPIPAKGIAAVTPLLRLKIKSDEAGSISLGKMTLAILSTNSDVKNLNLFGFTDPGYTNPILGFGDGGRVNHASQSPDASGLVEIFPAGLDGTPVPIRVEAGLTLYLEVRANVSPFPGVEDCQVITTLLGDSNWPTPAMDTLEGLHQQTHYRFIWSPNNRGVARVSDRDWTTGYQVPGLAVKGISQVRSK